MRFSCDISCEVFRFSKNVQNLRMDTLGSSAKINRADVQVWGVLSACMMGIDMRRGAVCCSVLQCVAVCCRRVGLMCRCGQSSVRA